MSETTRLIVALLAMSMPGLVLVERGIGNSSRAAAVDLEQLPDTVSAFSLRDSQRFEEETMEIVKPEQYVMRFYSGPRGADIWLYAGYYLGRLATNAHEPTVCYPAFGWEIEWSRGVDVPIEHGGSFRARLMRAELDGREELVLFWFQPVARWSSTDWAEQLLRIWDAIRGTPNYVFVRLSMELPVEGDPEAVMFDFARAVAPEIRTRLDVLAR